MSIDFVTLDLRVKQRISELQRDENLWDRLSGLSSAWTLILDRELYLVPRRAERDVLLDIRAQLEAAPDAKEVRQSLQAIEVGIDGDEHLPGPLRLALLRAGRRGYPLFPGKLSFLEARIADAEAMQQQKLSLVTRELATPRTRSLVGQTPF